MIYENNVAVEFFTQSVKNEAESKEAGRPIFQDMPFIRIQVPGDRNNEIEDRATDAHKQKYPKAWAMYQNLDVEIVEGTALKEWAVITRSQAEELAYFGIHTVESLSEVSDSHLQKLGPGYLQLRQKAADFLQSANESLKAQEWTKERDELLARIDKLEMALEAKKEAKKAKK